MIFNLHLADGELLDMGYGEFACTPRMAEELLDGGMTRVNGKPGRLTVVERFENAVLLRWTFTEPVAASVTAPVPLVALTEAEPTPVVEVAA
jgi:hypothetical protein